ncbi:MULTISPECIES: lipopolysaccharide transport periplasmic protein LptA [Cupriavidus]|uniref:Lipopolysaccharide export system protein LptA n=1 Tax=Cupriavidus oxalaticus TaxID=96344 RepID=A0A4P7L8I7_9BURK|nr:MULTISPECIES: lipopolysaccharide transport periplasmic protein LptA [Cupriavidus]MBF6990588.1 lipopolysaccharide transport periplasmic protein LptA [Cupriavidus sp. IK-TO18]QBY52054.1 lipopolysaccharide transport periplasmic protein LptA [Cupriavidus oxalaticus]TDF65883.1 lipopolysaccharide transport periplasmic protein LptA [Cupriavidus sp. L7L]
MTASLTTSSRRHAAPALLATAMAIGLLLAQPALAERADRDKPMVLEADNASYDDVKQIYTLTGNVVLTKGTMILKSDAAELRTDPEGYQFAVATAKAGKQAYIRQKREGVDEYIDGWGDRIEYDGKQELSKLIGNARMARLQGAKMLDEIRGAVLTYDSRKEFYTAAGGSDNTSAANPSGRVRAVLSPRQNPNAQGSGSGSPLDLKPAPAPANKP